MVANYSYVTGAVEYNIAFIRTDSLCRLYYGVPASVGGVACSKCPHNKGERDGFVLCGCQGAQSSNDEESKSQISRIKRELTEQIRHEALCALCY